MIKLLIFDLDGTLADTAQDIADAVNYALKPFVQRTYSVEETKAMVGSGISRLLASLLPENSEQNRETVLNRFLEYYSDHVIDNTTLYPHVKETLSSLKGYKKAVVSNKREALSKRVIEGLGIIHFFDVIFGSDSVPEIKPSPVPILTLLERFGASRDEAVIIGDSNYDVEAGRAAGVTTIAVTYGFRKRDVLKEADFIIDRFNELLNIIPYINEIRIRRNT